MKRNFTLPFILLLIFAATAVLCGCDKESAELAPTVALDRGLTYYFPFDGNSTNVVDNKTFEIDKASYSIDRFGEASKALMLGCKCGSSVGMYGIDLRLGAPEGALSIWVNFDDLNSVQPLFFKGIYGDTNPLDYSISTTSSKGIGFYWIGLEHDSDQGETPFRDIPNVFAIKKWQHLLFRWSNNEGVVEIFVSGKKVLSEKYLGKGVEEEAFGTNVAYIENKVGEDTYYRGRMDDLRIYDRWLNDEEVIALAK